MTTPRPVTIERETPGEDDPVTLAEACEIVFRGRITPATIRAEAARGRIVLSRIGKRDFTTLREARELLDKCRVAHSARGSISTAAGSSGSSVTVLTLSARAAANETVSALKRLSKPTSDGSTGPSRRQHR